MLLSELAEASGTSVASIKFYRREGLLPAGTRMTATRQDYGQQHLDRLQLIHVLRDLAHAPIPRIREVTELLDDPERSLLDALGLAQDVALGVEEPTADDRGEHPAIVPLLERLGWPDADIQPRHTLSSVLWSLQDWDAERAAFTLDAYAGPLAEIARTDIDWMSARSREAQASPQAKAPTEDEIVARAVTGTLAFDSLIRSLRTLGHASYSILDAQQAARPRPSPSAADTSGEPDAAEPEIDRGAPFRDHPDRPQRTVGKGRCTRGNASPGGSAD